MSNRTIRNLLGRINKVGPLNILTCPTHERYETGLAKTGHNFYALHGAGIKTWAEEYGERPANYQIIEEKDLENLHIDVVLSQQKFGQFQLLDPISKLLHAPLISLEHTLPNPNWRKGDEKELKKMSGDLNLFISKYSVKAWGYENGEAHIVKHGIDTNLFSSAQPMKARHNIALSVVNDWIKRDIFCGFGIWAEATRGLPTKVYGKTPGLSEPAKGVDGLIKVYNSHKIFINTSTVSPIPTSLMEAMSCGCAVVSTATCMIPEVIKDGYNGILCKTPQEIRNATITLMENPDICEKLGNNARKSVVEKYNQEQFIRRWNEIFEYARHLRRGVK